MIAIKLSDKILNIKIDEVIETNMIISVIYMVLKGIGVIDWSFIWILSPVWLSSLLFFLLGVIAIIDDAVLDLKEKHKEYGYKKDYRTTENRT